MADVARMTDEDFKQLELQPLAMRLKFDDERAGEHETLCFWAALMEGAHAEIVTLREALKPFADVSSQDIGTDEADADYFQPMNVHNRARRLTVGDFRRAATCIAGEVTETKP